MSSYSVSVSHGATAGNAVQTVKSSDAVKLITVRSTAFEAATVGAGSASTESGFALLFVVML